MKRMIAAVALLIISIALCITGNRVTTVLTDHLTETLVSAQKAAKANDRAKAYALSQQAHKEWDHSHKVLCTFQPHSRLDVIDQTLAALPDLSQSDTLGQFESECARGELLAKNLQESEYPLLQNIL